MDYYKGKVSGYMPRTESGVFRRRQTLVWDFRLERYDQSGKPLPRIAVETRAKYYRGGSINNGDVVEVRGRQSRNGVVTVGAISNLTAGTTIRAHNWNASVVLMYLTTLLVVLGIVAAGLYLVSGHGSMPTIGGRNVISTSQ